MAVGEWDQRQLCPDGTCIGVIGPDGRLYWTIADCGARVTSREGQLIDNPDSGAVFRCNLDGTSFELFATGSRGGFHTRNISCSRMLHVWWCKPTEKGAA